uniref:Transposase n=1 Tax=Ascaris lumbricoides TaxID=6252 RepID=A0A0M3HJH4_ASCLU
MTKACVQYLLSEMARAECIKTADNEVVLENYDQSGLSQPLFPFVS